MKIKKWVSAISALTIAASAFAGMAVTASASAYTVPYTLGANEYIKDVIIGVPSYDGETITAVESEDFELCDTGAGFTNDYFEGAIPVRNNSKATEVNEEYNIRATGKGIIIPLGASSEEAYPLKAEITSGKVVLRGEIVIPQREEFVEITGKDSNGNDITVCRVTSRDGGSNGACNIYIGQSTTATDSIHVLTRDRGLTISSIVVDVDTGRIDYTYDGVSHWSSGENPESKTGSATIADLQSVTGLKFGNTANRSGYETTFDNVQMYTVSATVLQHTVKVNYKLSDGTPVKETATYMVDDGEKFEPTYDATFDDDNYRYTYVSGADSIASVTKDEEINIIYSREALAEYTVRAVTSSDSDAQKVFATSTVKDGKDVSLTFPRYFVEGASVYQIVLDRYDQGYKSSLTNVKATQDITQKYTKFADNVSYFSEAEDIDGLVDVSSGTVPDRCSQGTAAYAATDTTIVTLQPGKYKATIAVFGNAASHASLVMGSGSDAKEVVGLDTVGYFTEKTGDEFTVTEPTTIVLTAFGNGGSSPKVVDYIMIIKTGDVATEPVAATFTQPTLDKDTFTENDGVWAKTFKFTVTPNSDVVTGVTVKPSEGESKTMSVSLSGKGSAVFGIIAASTEEENLADVSFETLITVQ